MITAKPYSDKGVAVHGCTPEQAEEIRAALGASVVTQYNAKLGGWLFSRRREAAIRGVVTAMNAGAQDAGPVYVSGEGFQDPPAYDDLPGKWGVLAERASASA